MPAKASSRLVFLAVCCALAAHARGATLTPALPDAYGMAPEALERAFWVCDHTATLHGVDATPMAACTSVFEALKQTKFGGDFSQLLAWWRENKLVEHTKLDAR